MSRPSSRQLLSDRTRDDELRQSIVPTADGEPIVYSREFLPPSVVAGEPKRLGDLSGSLYGVLAELGHAVHHGVATIEAVCATQDLARALGIRPGDARLYLTQIDSDGAGRPLLYSRELYRSPELQLTVYRRGPASATADR